MSQTDPVLHPMLIDSHVNLHSERYEDSEIKQLIERSIANNVCGMLTISDQLSNTQAIAAIADQYPFIWRSVGVHPHHAKDYPNLSGDELIALAKAPKVIGIGECGLDFYYAYSDAQAQRQVFSAHIEASQQSGLPLIIHTRDADEMMIEMLEEAFAKKSFVPLLHCYTSGPKLAERVYEMGGYISFSGILTFKNAQDVRDIAAAAPIDRIIIETDCPYLAPVPMRGRRNEPSFLVHVAECLAEVRDIDVTEVMTLTTQNFFRLFNRARENFSAGGEGINSKIEGAE